MAQWKTAISIPNWDQKAEVSLAGWEKNPFETAHDFGMYKWRLYPNSARGGSKAITWNHHVVTMAPVERGILKLCMAQVVFQQELKVIKLQLEDSEYYSNQHASFTTLLTQYCNRHIQNAFLASLFTPAPNTLHLCLQQHKYVLSLCSPTIPCFLTMMLISFSHFSLLIMPSLG